MLRSSQLLEARAQVKKHSPGTPLKGGSKAWKLAKAETKLKKLENKIAKIHKSLQSSAKSFKKIDNECMAGERRREAVRSEVKRVQ